MALQARIRFVDGSPVVYHTEEPAKPVTASTPSTGQPAKPAIWQTLEVAPERDVWPVIERDFYIKNPWTRRIVEDAARNIPEEPFKAVFLARRTVVIATGDGEERTFIIPSLAPKADNIIILTPFLNNSLSCAYDFAHEVAHAWRRHTYGSGTQEEIHRDEMEAISFAMDWGFSPG